MKTTLSHWLMDVIRHTYFILARENKIACANHHSVRGVATSWGEFARPPLNVICWAAAWSGPCSFARFYHLDLQVRTRILLL